MNPINIDEINSLRAEINTILDTACNLMIQSYTVGSAGGRKPVYSTIQTMCRITSLSTPDEKLYADKLNGISGWSILLPHNIELTSADKIEIDNNQYEIIGITNSVPTIFKRAICKLIN